MRFLWYKTKNINLWIPETGVRGWRREMGAGSQKAQTSVIIEISHKI